MRCQKADGTPHESSPRIAEYDNATESRLVLYAIRDALSRFNYGCKITIHTECHYVAAAVNQGWPKAWRDNGWKNSKQNPVTDQILWSEILQAAEETGHELIAQEGKHEWSGWMRWNIPLTDTYKDFFAEVKNEFYSGTSRVKLVLTSANQDKKQRIVPVQPDTRERRRDGTQIRNF